MKSALRFKSALGSGLLLVLLTGGCHTNTETIVFKDEQSARMQETTIDLKAAPKPKKLSKPDEQQVERLVFGYLLGRHFFDTGDYTGVFLQTSDEQVAAVQAQFPGHVPPIKASYRVDMPANRTPVDKDTGKPAMVLTVETAEPEADDSVDALGRWYAGGAVTGFYTFHLRKTADGWRIETVN